MYTGYYLYNRRGIYLYSPSLFWLPDIPIVILKGGNIFVSTSFIGKSTSPCHFRILELGNGETSPEIVSRTSSVVYVMRVLLLRYVFLFAVKQ